LIDELISSAEITPKSTGNRCTRAPTLRINSEPPEFGGIARTARLRPARRRYHAFVGEFNGNMW